MGAMVCWKHVTPASPNNRKLHEGTKHATQLPTVLLGYAERLSDSIRDFQILCAFQT